MFISDTYCFVFDSSAELYLQGAGAGRPQHLGQLRGGGGVEGVHCHGVGHGDAGLHALMMGWKFVDRFITYYIKQGLGNNKIQSPVSINDINGNFNASLKVVLGILSYSG